MSYYESPASDNGGSFPRSAAKFAVIAPGLAILVNAALRVATKSDDGSNHLATAVGALVSFVLISGGFVSALIALSCVGRFGREGLLGRGIAGLLLNGVLLGVFAVGFIHGFSRGFAAKVKARESQRNVETALNDLRGDLRRNFDPQSGVTNVDLAKTEAVRKSLDEAATHATGEDAMALKAGSAFLAQVEMAARNLQGAFSVMEAARVLQFTNAPSQDDFQRRRRLVQNYQIASEKARAVVTNAPAFFRAELQKLGASPSNIDKMVAEMQRRSAPQHALICQVRDADAQMTSAMLQVFDLLERNSGQWEVTSGQVLFDNARSASSYNQLIETIEAAANDQIEAQRKLVSLK